MSIPWKERLAEGRIVPHFQPIVSLETLQITAYEALGRQVIGSEVQSLGPFFEAGARDASLADLRKDVDRSLRQAALTEFASWQDRSLRLFLNVSPRLMADHLRLHPTQLPWTLKLIEELPINPSQVVIELTEEAVDGDIGSLRRLVDLYRSRGCAIAVDDVGTHSSNLDRIGYFEPDIIKVDAAILRRSLEHRSFRQILKGVSSMAEGLGAALLFEGVETEEDMRQALAFGARYAQGHFFARAEARPLPSHHFQGRLLPFLRSFGHQLAEGAVQARQRIRETMESLGRTPEPVQFPNGAWGFPPGALEFWGLGACRIFLTDHAGFQVSPDYEAGPQGWRAATTGRGNCRAMRPYFPGTGDSRWSVSDVYYDINDRSLMRTYSRPAGPNLLVFVDVREIENSGRNS